MSSQATAEKVEIVELVNRYFAALDQKQIDSATMSALFAADAKILRPNGTVMLGPQGVAESHSLSLSRFRATQHVTSGFIVAFDENQRAGEFRANLVAVHMWAEGHGGQRTDPSDNCFVAGGVITGRVALGTAGWEISELANQVTWRHGVGLRQMLETK